MDGRIYGKKGRQLEMKEKDKESCKQNPRRVSPSADSRQARFGAGVSARFFACFLCVFV